MRSWPALARPGARTLRATKAGPPPLFPPTNSRRRREPGQRVPEVSRVVEIPQPNGTQNGPDALGLRCLQCRAHRFRNESRRAEVEARLLDDSPPEALDVG